MTYCNFTFYCNYSWKRNVKCFGHFNVKSQTLHTAHTAYSAIHHPSGVSRTEVLSQPSLLQPKPVHICHRKRGHNDGLYGARIGAARVLRLEQTLRVSGRGARALKRRPASREGMGASAIWRSQFSLLRRTLVIISSVQGRFPKVQISIFPDS